MHQTIFGKWNIPKNIYVCTGIKKKDGKSIFDNKYPDQFLNGGVNILDFLFIEHHRFTLFFYAKYLAEKKIATIMQHVSISSLLCDKLPLHFLAKNEFLSTLYSK